MSAKSQPKLYASDTQSAVHLNSKFSETRLITCHLGNEGLRKMRMKRIGSSIRFLRSGVKRGEKTSSAKIYFELTNINPL